MFAIATALVLLSPPASPAPPPCPEAEQKVLEDHVGTWDATVETYVAPGEPKVSKAVEVNTLVGGRWLVTERKGTRMEQPFEGHGILGWDTGRKKLVGSWVDSEATGLQTLEQEFDPTAKILSGYYEATDMVGQNVRSRTITEWKDKDTRVFTMFQPGPPGKEEIAMRITFSRRK